jgi:hypothetical protein
MQFQVGMVIRKEILKYHFTPYAEGAIAQKQGEQQTTDEHHQPVTGDKPAEPV